MLSVLLLVAALLGSIGSAFLGLHSAPANPTTLDTSSSSSTPSESAGRDDAGSRPTPQRSSPSIYNNNAQLSLPLAGRRIGLDPGHGPRSDLGAVVLDPNTGKLVLSEAEFNLDVALRCRDLLRARGASVVLTRESANTFTAPWPSDANGDGIVGGAKDDLQERVDILNAFHAEVFLDIHANNVPNQRDVRGIQVFYCSTSDCAFSAESKRLGTLVLDQLQTKLDAAGYPVENRQLRSDLSLDAQHIFLLGPVNPPTHVRATLMPGVLSESLYLSSPEEAAQLKRDSVRQAIALAYADALQAYLTGR